VNKDTMIAIPADPDDPEDFDVSVAGLEQAQEERRLRLRGPQRAPTKVPVTLRLDRDIVERFRATGAGWQSRMNDALRRADL